MHNTGTAGGLSRTPATSFFWFGVCRMLFTSSIILAFLAVGVLAVVAGFFMRKHELYIFGAVVLLLSGLILLTGDVSSVQGENIVTYSGNETVLNQTMTYVYAPQSDNWTNALGILSVVVAAGLSLTWWGSKQREEQKKKNSLDIEDE